VIARVLRVLLWCVLGFFTLSFVAVLALRWIDPVTSTFIVHDRIADAIGHDPKFHYRREWVDAQRISPAMKLAVIAAEDQKFADHWGFDFDSINDAIEQHERGRRLRGASTISQQTAKNLFLWSGQSFVRKGLEAYFTLLIELTWPKHRILEVYLNVAQFGNGIYGVEAASQTFFHKPAARLNSSEAAALAAVLPNPIRFKADAPSNYIRARRGWIMTQMEHLSAERYLARLR
jgi:monofunctional biosynthetic peptidoglycan transglycosylase